MRYKTILLIITVQCLCITNAFPQYVARKESIKFKLLKREENILEVKNKDAIKDYNLIYLNRGTSDGVFLNNHYKFYYAGGYLARGVCIDSDLFRSIWLTYNSYGLNKIELQAQLSGRRVDNYLIPKRVQNIYSILDNQMDDIRYRMAEGDTPEEYIQRMSYKRKLDNLDEETIQIVDENEKFDLNPDIEIDIVSGEEEESGDLLDISISASPISFNRIPKTKDIGYSFSVSCADCGDKELSFSYSYDHTTELPSRSEYDEEDPAILTSSNYSASISFDWNKIYGPITFWMFLSWSRSRTSDVVGGENVYNPSYLYTGIPFGLKWDIYESDKVADLSLSWGPQMDFERVQYIDYDDDFNEIDARLSAGWYVHSGQRKRYLKLDLNNFN